jgi:hypothetical protein
MAHAISIATLHKNKAIGAVRPSLIREFIVKSIRMFQMPGQSGDASRHGGRAAPAEA